MSIPDSGKYGSKIHGLAAPPILEHRAKKGITASTASKHKRRNPTLTLNGIGTIYIYIYMYTVVLLLLSLLLTLQDNVD